MKMPGWIARIGVLAALLVTCQCGNETPPETGGGKKGPVGERPVFVKTAHLTRGPVDRRLGFVGELAASETVEVAAKLAGRIQGIKVRMGDTVKKGEIIVVIEDSQLRAQLKEAAAALAVAKADIRRAEVQEKNAANEVARKTRLREKDLVTAQEMDNLTSKQATEAAALALATAEASQAEARIALIRTQLRDAKIRAPFTGKVAARYLDPGAVVNPGTAILQIIDVNPILVRFKVPERYLGVITAGGNGGDGVGVEVRLDAFPDRTFPGKVARISPALDKATRSASVEAEVSTESGPVAPGMYGRVELDLGRVEDALLVPATALLDDTRATEGSSGIEGPREGQVFTVKDGRAHRQKISLGARSDGHIEVLSGLAPEDSVVVEGAGLLKEGARVEVLESGRPNTPKSAGAKQ